MNSSVPPIRRIASNLLWTAEGIVRNPLLEVAADGTVCRAGTCDAPDRVPFAEFYAGLLVPGFPADWQQAFARIAADAATPLDEQLRRLPPSPGGVLVVISGLDYERMLLTPDSRIRSLFP